MNKKIIAILLTICLAALLGGCGGGASESSEQKEPAKEVMDGFDKETNQKVTIGNVKFSVPDYYEEDEDTTDTKVNYKASNSAMINISSDDAEGKAGDFEADKQQKMAESVVEKFDNSELTEIVKDQDINGMPAGIYDFTASSNQTTITGRGCVMYNENYDTVVNIIMIQDDNSKYDYFPDFDKIVQSAKAEKRPKVSKDFKKTMDDYEAFFDKYVEFMKNYQESGDVMGMLSDYTEIMSQYSEMMSGLESIDTDSLSPADYAYYMEVYGRITEKLLEVTGQ